MSVKPLRVFGSAFGALFLGAWLAAPNSAIAADFGSERSDPHNSFVMREGSELELKGKPFRFAGSNNYYPMYVSQFMVDSLFDKAQASGFDVMRVWGSLVIGHADGTNSIDPSNTSVFFQYWNDSADAPAFNDGDNGLKHLDYVVYKAGLDHLKLVLPLVNNWSAFGGIDQYVQWAGGTFHDEFFTSQTIKGWYKDWILHLLNHVNFYSGIKYKDDPTIMMFDLVNEPRCKGSIPNGKYPASSTCTSDTLADWAAEMSTFIKQNDHHLLVSMGDEGFLCLDKTSPDFTIACTDGVDSLKFAAVRNIDVMSLHMYPDYWTSQQSPKNQNADWGTDWIKTHARMAREIRKPVYLGEYGWLDKNTRNSVYQQWTDEVVRSDTNGSLYWILSDLQDGGSLYPDYDGFTVYCPSSVCTTETNFAAMMHADRSLYFPPVAGDVFASTRFATPVSLTPLANDISYLKTSIGAGSIDLDPTTSGVQLSISVFGGTFAVQSNETVLFTPTPGFSGNTQTPYTITDSRGNVSNTALLQVTVAPDPNAAIVLYSFEFGADGWAYPPWQANGGSTSQTTAFATDGSHGLQIQAANGGWVGLNVATPFDLSGKTHLKADLETLAVGTSTNFALQLTGSFQWCQGSYSFQNPNTIGTVDVDMTTLVTTSNAPCPVGRNDVVAIWFFTSAGGTYYVDKVRAE
jgi:mannan endo-1,4-beta-mannosidase